MTEAQDPRAEPSGARLVELSLSPPPAPTATTQAVQSCLVQTIDTSRFSPPGPDPSGLAYHPGRNHLVMSDGEVDEMSIWAGANIFEMTLAGTLVDTSSTLAFSAEPTGVAYAPTSVHWFFSDDSTTQRKVFEIDAGPDGRVGTCDERSQLDQHRRLRLERPRGARL